MVVLLALLAGMWMLVGFLSQPISTDGTADEILRGARFPEADPDLDVRGLISIRSPDDASRIRADLTRFLWGDEGLPKHRPVVESLDPTDPSLEGLAVPRAERWTVGMEFGLESHVVSFQPAEPLSGTVFYHQGHFRGLADDVDQIQRLLDRGHPVVYFDMPLDGGNNRPRIELASGLIQLESHEQLKLLLPEAGHPVKLLLEPVIVALNQVEEAGAVPVWMVGISGGGWTTTLAAAIDPRIRQSFPVAGSQPFYVREITRNRHGDYEQTVPELYEVANYLEFYVLGAWGEGRRQLQILNEFDPCCFRSREFERYQPVVNAVVQELGAGDFDVFYDGSHREHEISSASLERIFGEIEPR